MKQDNGRTGQQVHHRFGHGPIIHFVNYTSRYRDTLRDVESDMIPARQPQIADCTAITINEKGLQAALAHTFDSEACRLRGLRRRPSHGMDRQVAKKM